LYPYGGLDCARSGICILWALPYFVRLFFTAVRTIEIHPFLSELFLSQLVRYKSHS